MSIISIIILAIIQGLTEFLPVSSSAHLILAERWLGIAGEGGLPIVIAVHFGSLFAVMIYFRVEVVRMLRGALDLVLFRFGTSNAQLDLKLIVATLPVVVIGFGLSRMSAYEAISQSPIVIALAMIVFGLILYFADKKSAVTRGFEDFNFKDAIVMGFWQAIALIPGTSRSGATITASRILGFNRQDGARIAMLMSIPTILAASLLIAIDIAREGRVQDIGTDALLAALFAFIAAYFALSLMMRFLRSSDYTPYVVYRVILGALLLFIYL